MLDGIDRTGASRVTASPRAATPAQTATPARTPPPTAEAVPQTAVSQTSVFVSITTTVVTVTADPSVDGLAPDVTAVPATAADEAAGRAQEALQRITAAKGKAAGAMKEFLRQKLDGLKKQMQILRILGTDALEIAKGSVKIAREVAGTARDYAAATIDQKKAGILPADTITAAEAQKQADALQARAAQAPLTTDPASNDPSGAPTDPDERFFYDAYRLLGLARRTLVETQRIDTRQHGLAHAKDFKKLSQREGDMEKAVTEAYKAMKTGGDLKAVDALLSDGGGSQPGMTILA